MNKIMLTVVLGMLLAVVPAFSTGDLLIKNGTVLTVTKGAIARGDILISDGIIRQIGGNISAPAGVKVIDASGKFVIPGIIDSHTHIALSGTNEMGDAITAEVNMRDVLDAEDLSILTALSGGVTMIHTLHGSANPIGGQNITLKLKWGRPAEELIVPQALRTLKFALGENPKQANRPAGAGQQRYPASRMGVNAIIRRELMRAKNYLEQWEKYDAARKSKNPPKNLLPPRRDLRLEALADLLRGNLVARCHSYRADETLEFINLAKEFGFKIACFEHIPEAFKITRELAQNGIGTSVFLDSWAYKVEASEGIAYSAAYCTKQGVLVSLNSDSSERIRRLFNEAGKAMKYGGLSEDEALRLITINPAIELGVDKIVGSLEVGKHGDVAIFNEHPMSAYTRCDMTIIEGDVYFDRDQYLKEKEEKEAAKKREKTKTAGGGQ
jgi:imidazolonepropionase-like amidohydrolase